MRVVFLVSFINVLIIERAELTLFIPGTPDAVLFFFFFFFSPNDEIEMQPQNQAEHSPVNY